MWKVLPVYMFQEEEKDIMVVEFGKYKRILKREDEELKEVMKAEVCTSLPSNLSKQNERYNSGKTHVITHFTLKFAQFHLIDIPFHSYNNNIILF